jgi:hypothetical protein
VLILFFNYEIILCVLCGLKKSLNLGRRRGGIGVAEKEVYGNSENNQN